jgi:hypothetical protein
MREMMETANRRPGAKKAADKLQRQIDEFDEQSRRSQAGGA